MRGKRKMPRKRFFSRRVKSRRSRKAPTAMSAVLGLILTTLFASVIASAPAQATGGGGNLDCPDGTITLAKYNWDEEANAYVAEFGDDIVTVTGNTEGGTFTVIDGTHVVTVVIVKASTDAKMDTYNPGVTSGEFDNSDLTTPSGQEAAISNIKFCGNPYDECPELDGNQPPGTDCTQPPDDRETRDLPGVVDCESDTYTVEHQERTREYSWDGDSWEPGPWSEWTTYDTTVTEATDEQCPPPPNPVPGTATATPGACVAPGQATGVVTVTVTNTNDETDESVTYEVTLGSEVKSITLADGASGSVQFTGLAAGTYAWSVTGPDGTKVKNNVTVAACDVPPPPPPSYECPPGTTWVDSDGDGVVDQGECDKLVHKPRASVNASCVTQNYGEGVATLKNKGDFVEKFRIVRSGSDVFVKLRPGKSKTVNLFGLKVGSVVKVKSRGDVLDRDKVEMRPVCQPAPTPHTGLRESMAPA